MHHYVLQGILVLFCLTGLAQTPQAWHALVGNVTPEASSASFSPLDLNPKIWYVATNVPGTPSNGTAVGRLVDGSTNGWDAWQSAAGAAYDPFYTNSSLLKLAAICSPDGSRQLTISNSVGALNMTRNLGAYTLCALVVPYTSTASAPDPIVMGMSDAAGYTRGRIRAKTGTDGLNMYGRAVMGTAGATYTAGTIAAGVPIRIVAQFDYANSTWSMWTNNVSAGTSSVSVGATATEDLACYTDNNTLFTLVNNPAGTAFTGLIAEVLVVPRVLTSDERTSLNTYWGTKWIP